MVWCVAFGCSNGEKKTPRREMFPCTDIQHSCIRWWRKRCVTRLTKAKEFDAELVSSRTIAGPEIDCAPTAVCRRLMLSPGAVLRRVLKRRKTFPASQAFLTKLSQTDNCILDQCF